jgi:hypothetical protein
MFHGKPDGETTRVIRSMATVAQEAPFVGILIGEGHFGLLGHVESSSDEEVGP